MPRRSRNALVPVLAWCSLSSAPWFVHARAVAQQPGAPSPFADATNRSVLIGRVSAADAPRIDGHLTDPCWAHAPEIGPLVEVEPIEGVVPGQRTVVRMLHDADAIYLAIECFDDAPGEIRASQRLRDANLDPDDRVEWMFDTFHNRRLGYWFQIGAGGSRGDALVSQGGNSFNKSWDAIWDGRARVTDRGWHAEVAIPFRSLAQRDGAGTWGFNLRRLRRADNAEHRWNFAKQGRRFFQVAEAGELRGIGQTRAGLGLEFVPFAVTQWSRDRSQSRRFDFDPDAGGEIFYRLTPQLSFSTTFFTDFAETENDSRQINLNRFPLFFPEKRDFFLQDAGRFEFGPDGSQGGLIPFFSRRIGLASGEKVPILFGAKLAGEVGPWSVGVLNAQTDEVGGLATDRNLSVVRVNRTLGEQTTLGGIVTHGRPASPGSNTVFGLDAYHREGSWIGDMDLRLWAYGLMSQTSGPGGEGNAWGVRARSQGREWSLGASTRWVGEEFNPELGFLRRRGVREQAAEFGYEPRLSGPVLRKFTLEGNAAWVVDESNRTEDIDLDLEVGFDGNMGDSVSMTVSREFERVGDAFTLFDRVATIQAGDYWQSRWGVQARSSDGRAFSGSASVSVGDFFDGTSVRTALSTDWRTGPLLILGAELSQTEVDLPQGSFTTLVAEGRADVHFSPMTSWLNLVQFDNESDLLGVQSRVRWIMRPGSDLFVVVAGGWLRSEGSLRPQDQGLTVKLSHSIRF